MQNAQDLSSPLGKIHRVNDDGTIPGDNPFVKTPNAVPSIWSYGHRNPQGLAWDPISGRLWETEHGPTAGDEVNIIERGHNYGWGIATKGTQPGITKSSEPGMDEPVVYYIPTYAPAGISFSTSDRYPAWKNTSLFRRRSRRAGPSPSRNLWQPGDAAGSDLQSVRPRSRRGRGTGRLLVLSPSTTPLVRERHTVSSRRCLAGSSGSCQCSSCSVRSGQQRGRKAGNPGLPMPLP
jgi:hypothetical protein